MTQVSGEEVRPLNFSRGLFLSESNEDIPDGCNEIQSNLFMDDAGHLYGRGSFVNVGYYEHDNTTRPREPNSYIEPVENYPPDFPFAYQRRVFSVFKPPIPTIAATTTYLPFPSIILSRQDYTAGAEENRFHSINSSNRGLAQATNRINPVGWVLGSRVTGMAQYKDRFYISGQTTTAYSATGGFVKRISGWDFDGAPADLTHTALTNPITIKCDGLVSFRDRMFTWWENRIYYTEVATVGGYPEDWNSGNNAITVQSGEDGLTIHNILVLNDKLFIFTDSGIFHLYATGSPLNWYLQTLSREYRTFGRNGSCLVKDSIVFTDRSAVYVYTGDDVKTISGPIAHEINRSTTTTVTPFEDGVIVSCNNMHSADQAIAVGANNYTVKWWTLTSARHFYFDGNTWAEITFFNIDNDVYRNIAIIAGFTNKVTYADSGRAASYIVTIEEPDEPPNGLVPKYTVLRYSSEDFMDDQVSNDADPIVFEFKSRPYRNSLMGLATRVKYGYFNIMTLLNTVLVSYIRDDEDNIGETIVTSGNDVSLSYLIKVIAPQFSRKIAAYFVTTSFALDMGIIEDNLPSTLLRIREINVYLNSDNATQNEKITV